MFTSLLEKEKPKNRKQLKNQYQQPTTTQTESNSNQVRRKRGFSLSKQHSIAFDRMYAPKDLDKQSKIGKEEQSQEVGSSESRVSGSSQSKKLTLKSVKSQKMLLTSDSSSNFGSRSRISIGGVSKSKSRNMLMEESNVAYGKISTKEHKSPSCRAEYGFVRRR